jgi:UDP-glucuronate 4-epimerase
MKRDFTYIDDIVYGIMGAMNLKFLGHSVYNLGNNKPEDLNDIIQILESTIGKKAVINFSPMQPGDVEATWADISDSIRDLSFKPITTIHTGIPKFVEWYKEYYSR